MTTEPPDADALCSFVNGSQRAVDVSVNYRDEAYATIKPDEDQATFSVDSDANGQYGTYTFEARAKDDPGGDVLAAASVAFNRGDCYVAAFHPAGETDDGETTYQLSIYEIDVAPTGDSRFQLHHAGAPERVHWTLAPKEEADPRIEPDTRSGTLERGEWQQAIDVTENEYRLEVSLDEDTEDAGTDDAGAEDAGADDGTEAGTEDDRPVAAFLPDLELEAERLTVCFLVGDPNPDLGADAKQAHVLEQRYQVPSGRGRPDETTDPAPPHAATDENASVAVACDPPTMYETNRYEVLVTATDPDGVVTGLALDGVDPATDGIRLPEDSVSAAADVGEPATGSLTVAPTVPPGTYAATVLTNPDGIGERVAATVELPVRAVTADRVCDLIAHYQANDAVADSVADELYRLLAAAGAAPPDRGGLLDDLVDDVLGLFGAERDDGAPDDPTTALSEASAVVAANQGDGVTDAAAADLQTELDTLLQQRRRD